MTVPKEIHTPFMFWPFLLAYGPRTAQEAQICSLSG